MGLGLLGRGLGDTLFLIRAGAHVTVTDLKNRDELAPSLEHLRGLPVTLKLGGHEVQDFVSADMVLRNADVPRSSSFLQIAREHGVPVEMDESLFCKHFQGRVVGITGTRGKTTTSMLIHGILSSHRSGVFLGGNIIGHATLPLLEKVGKDHTVVLELSSWQLQGFHDSRLSPNVSVFTNIYPDHLNRYATMEEYIDDKKAIYRYQKSGDICLFNWDQPQTARLAGEAPARKDWFKVSDIPQDWQIRLPGRHNVQNVAAAAKLTSLMGVPQQVIRTAVEEFTGVEHRLEWLGERDGIAFVNDSTSTTPVASCAALEAMQGRRILLLAGGADKKLDLQAFGQAVASQATWVALLEGTATDALQQGIIDSGGSEKVVGRFDDLKKAVRSLVDHALDGDLVLLSPGCASFGMFRNEFDRGLQFKQIVNEIIRGGDAPGTV